MSSTELVCHFIESVGAILPHVKRFGQVANPFWKTKMVILPVKCPNWNFFFQFSEPWCHFSQL